MKAHSWKEEWLQDPDPDNSEGSHSVMVCKRCGLEVGMVLPGVPNLNGAIEVERDCDIELVRGIMKA